VDKIGDIIEYNYRRSFTSTFIITRFYLDHYFETIWMSNNLVHKTRLCQPQIRTFIFILINIRKKSTQLFFSHESRRELKAITTIIIIKREPFLHPILFFYLFRISLFPPSLSLSCFLLSSFFLLFSRTHASVHCWLEKENERRPWTICQRAACVLAITRKTLAVVMMLLLLFLCVITHKHAVAHSSRLRESRIRTRKHPFITMFYSYIVLWGKEIKAEIYRVPFIHRQTERKRIKELFLET